MEACCGAREVAVMKKGEGQKTKERKRKNTEKLKSMREKEQVRQKSKREKVKQKKERMEGTYRGKWSRKFSRGETKMAEGNRGYL